MKVKDPSEQTWRVSRRWVPWRRRVTAIDDHTPDLTGLQGLGDDPISLIIAVIAAVLLLPFLVIALVASLELLLLLLLLPLAILVRAVFGKHWHVEVRRGWRAWWEAPSGDWQASGLRIDEVADAIRRGQTPPQTIGKIKAAAKEQGSASE